MQSVDWIINKQQQIADARLSIAIFKHIFMQ